jgi:hypothetical protein
VIDINELDVGENWSEPKLTTDVPLKLLPFRVRVKSVVLIWISGGDRLSNTGTALCGWMESPPGGSEGGLLPPPGPGFSTMKWNSTCWTAGETVPFPVSMDSALACNN